MVLAFFRACQTIDRCFQQPGIFSMQPFCIELSINMLLSIRWASRHLETKLKKSLPSTLKRAIGRKPESLFSEGLLTLGMFIFWALRHWMRISHFLKQVWKGLKRNLLILGYKGVVVWPQFPVEIIQPALYYKKIWFLGKGLKLDS